MDFHPHESSAVHVYEPLCGPEYIRLMTLEPALSPNAPLRLTSFQAELSHIEGQYETISYTWGFPNLTCPLYMSCGTHIMVTENLDRALRRLRLSHRVRVLWADAVCINQADDKEKEIQIPLMVHIYRGAGKVLAWLGYGEQTGDEEKGMQFLNRISRRRREDVTMRTHRTWRPPPDSLDMDVRAHLSGILDFLKLPWFNRLWIVQEVVFNVDVLLICGTSELSWARTIAALSIVRTTNTWNSLSVARDKLAAIHKMGKLWRHHCIIDDLGVDSSDPFRINSIEPAEDIIGLVEQFAAYGCTDPRDRIFALYSMTSDIEPRIEQLPPTPKALNHGSHVLMDIDYSLNVYKTYRAFALACLRVQRTSSIIHAVLCRRNSAIPQNWPSWVPDWRISPETKEPLLATITFHAEDPLANSICVSANVHEHLVDSWRRRYPTVEALFSRRWQEGGDSTLQYLLDTYRILGANGHFVDLFLLLRSMMDIQELVDDVTALEQCLYGLLDLSDEASLRSQVPIVSAQFSNVLHQVRNKMKGRVFFNTYLPETSTRGGNPPRLRFGYGDANIEPGDQLYPLNSSKETPNSRNVLPLGIAQVLILRPLYTNFSNGTCHRFIGSGYMYDSIVASEPDYNTDPLGLQESSSPAYLWLS